jgi:hypothetical protein
MMKLWKRLLSKSRKKTFVIGSHTVAIVPHLSEKGCQRKPHSLVLLTGEGLKVFPYTLAPTPCFTFNLPVTPLGW